MKNGLLCIYLFAESTREANSGATAIIEQLPYELIREKAIACHGKIPALDESPEMKDCHETAIAMAWQLSIGFTIASVRDEQWIDDYFAAHA